MEENAKIPISFYQISSAFISEDSFDDVIDRFKRFLNTDSRKYEETELTYPRDGEYRVRLFHSAKTAPPKWRSFFSEIVTPGGTILKCQNTTQSFLLFVGYKSRIFAISGGSGSFALTPYISNTFGIDIITRLIEKNSPVIKGLQNRGVTGTLLTQAKNFRTDSRLADENEFGQIYNEVRADLNTKILTSIFGFKKSELKRKVSGCLAKTSFKLNKSLDFKSFLRVVANLDSLLDKPANFTINSVERISKKSSITLIGKLEESLIGTLYEKYLNSEEPDFDFVHQDIDKYLQAANYKLFFSGGVIEFDEAPSFSEIQESLAAEGVLMVEDAYQFKYSLLDVRLVTNDENGNQLTEGSILSHIHGEIYYEGQNFFRLDNEWYRIGPKFIQDLNDELSLVLEQHLDSSIIAQPFDINQDEGKFNLSFVGLPGIIVLDTITPECIELCDILKHGGDSMYLIHVKKGFNNMFRDLAGQIRLAAKRIQHDRKSGYEYLSKVEKWVKGLKNSRSDSKRILGEQEFPNGGFVELFKSYRDINICFCLAFVDTSDSMRTLENDLQSFKSNIAKYSLLELISQIKAMGFDFKILQLKRADADHSSSKNELEIFSPN